MTRFIPLQERVVAAVQYPRYETVSSCHSAETFHPPPLSSQPLPVRYVTSSSSMSYHLLEYNLITGDPKREAGRRRGGAKHNTTPSDGESQVFTGSLFPSGSRSDSECQDPNTQCSKERLFIRTQTHHLQISGVIPFVKL